MFKSSVCFATPASSRHGAAFCWTSHHCAGIHSLLAAPSRPRKQRLSLSRKRFRAPSSQTLLQQAPQRDQQKKENRRALLFPIFTVTENAYRQKPKVPHSKLPTLHREPEQDEDGERVYRLNTRRFTF